MPASIFQGILEAVLELGCYFIGRLVVPLVSFGRWQCDQLTANTPRRKLRTAGIYHLRGRQVYLTAEATQFVGLLEFLLFIGIGILVWHLRKS